MSTKKYHVNPKTGRPGECRAIHQCKFGDEKSHFDSKEEAQKAIEKKLSELNVAPAIRKSKPSKDPSTKTIEEIKKERRDLQKKVDEVKVSSREAEHEADVLEKVYKKASSADQRKMKDILKAAQSNRDELHKTEAQVTKELNNFDKEHKPRLDEINRTEKAREAAKRIQESQSATSPGCASPRQMTRARC